MVVTASLAGPLPLSIRAFYSEVGEINFFGRHYISGFLSEELSFLRKDILPIENFLFPVLNDQFDRIS